MQDKIDKIYSLYEKYKKNDVHINDNDDFLTRRTKDMHFGALLAIERVIEILKS
jgi:hypothetical protein